MDDLLGKVPIVAAADLKKAFNSLIGIVEGIVIDATVNEQEISALRDWTKKYEVFRPTHPFNELFPLVEQVLYERSLTLDEKQDILWLCEKLCSEQYGKQVAVDMERLHALLAGIMADGVITEQELRGLDDWLHDHEHLRKTWPYDEIDAFISAVMEDQRLNPEEQNILKQFFTIFTPSI